MNTVNKIPRVGEVWTPARGGTVDRIVVWVSERRMGSRVGYRNKLKDGSWNGYVKGCWLLKWQQWAKTASATVTEAS